MHADRLETIRDRVLRAQPQHILRAIAERLFLGQHPIALITLIAQRQSSYKGCGKDATQFITKWDENRTTFTDTIRQTARPTKQSFKTIRPRACRPVP